MKATEEQYETAVKIYAESGQSAVYQYADEIGVDEDSPCPYCDTPTPDYADQWNSIRCLVCGTSKQAKAVDAYLAGRNMEKNYNIELRRQKIRAEQATMVDAYLAGKCEHPI